MAVYRRAYISTCEAFGWEGGPGFNTNIVTLRNRSEVSNAEWDQPQHFFSLSFLNIPPALYTPIKQMHLNCRGRNGRFLYQDRLDCTATEEIFAVAEAGQTEFQLSKLSLIDGVVYQRYVYALYTPDEDDPGQANEATPTILVDDVPAMGWTFDHDRGKAISPSPMAGGEVLRWSGLFSLWVRFDNDRLPFSIDNKSGGEFVINGSVELLEMAAPPDGGSS